MHIDISDETFKGIIGLLVSIPVFVFGLYFFLKRIRVLRNGIKTTGTLMELKRSSGKAPSYYPVIGYTTITNQWIVKEYEVSGRYAKHKIGDDIVIVYDKNNSEDFIIDDLSSLIIGPLFTVIGIVAFFACACCLILKS